MKFTILRADSLAFLIIVKLHLITASFVRTYFYNQYQSDTRIDNQKFIYVSKKPELCPSSEGILEWNIAYVETIMVKNFNSFPNIAQYFFCKKFFQILF